MKKGILCILGISLWLIHGSFRIVQNQEFTLTIIIKNIKKIEGNMLIAVHNSASTFLNERYQSASVKITDNTLKTSILGIEKGTYGVAIFQDVNANGKLDTNMMGIPKEPYGFSNDAKAMFSAPSFEDAKFEVKADTKITITL